MDRGNLLILECVIIQEVKSSVHVFIRLGVPHSHILTFASQFLEDIKIINIFVILVLNVKVPLRVKAQSRDLSLQHYFLTHSSVNGICITPYVAVSRHWLEINKSQFNT